jgi:hypothetical protein
VRLKAVGAVWIIYDGNEVMGRRWKCEVRAGAPSEIENSNKQTVKSGMV